MKYKILLITNDFLPDLGGIQSYLADFVNCFSKKNIIIYASSAKNQTEFDKKYRYKIIRDKSKTLLPTLRVKKNIVELIKKHKITHVWFGASLPLGLSAKYIKKHFSNIKILSSTHGHEIWWAKFLTPLYKKMVKYSDKVSYITDYTFSKLRKDLNENEKNKFIKISPCVRKNEHRNKTKIIPDKYILCISRLTKRKGQDTLINCMNNINKRYPNVKLVISGSGNYEKYLKRISNKNIIFTGKVSERDKYNLLQNCTLFAMPCRNRWFNMEVEGLGIVFLEASLCKKPIIVGNSGGANETVINNKTGFLVNSEKEVTNKLLKLLSNQKLCDDMGKSGYDFIKENWMIEKRFESLKDAFGII